MNEYIIWRELAELEKHWFIDRAYFFGRAGYYGDAEEAWLCLRPKYGHEIIKFNIPKCPIEGYFNYMYGINKAKEYLTSYTVFKLNIKTFFCYFKSML